MSESRDPEPAALDREEQPLRQQAREPDLRRLVAAGTQLRPFPQEVMEAAFNAANELYAEISKENADFKKIHDAYMGFRDHEIPWFRIAEGSFDQYMATAAK